MNETQDTIAIPVAYLEAFLMMFVAFLIGYIGASMYAKLKAKKRESEIEAERQRLQEEISRLREENERIPEDQFRKDRMDQELEQVQFQKRAFSERVLTQQANNDTPVINFDRIGTANADKKDNLQDIVGIGPYTEAKLNDLGIYTFEQISKFTDEDIETITELIKFFPDRIKNDRWVAKANELKYSATQSEDNGEESIKKKMMTSDD
jgi:predicted flap endonuclease-1-like 5' DNA nuclease